MASSSFSIKNILGVILVTGAFVLLILLGNWQMQRLEWKTTLLSEMNAAIEADPVLLPDDAFSLPEYARVRISGVLDTEQNMYVHGMGKVEGGERQPGFFVFTPLLRDGTPTLIINRGFVLPEFVDQMDPIEGDVQTGRAFTGYVRNSYQKKTFIPDNNTATNRWFYANVDEMAAYAHIDRVVPRFVFVEPHEKQSDQLIPQELRLDIPNNHLGYAITWYGLAMALLGVVFVYIRRKVTK